MENPADDGDGILDNSGIDSFDAVIGLIEDIIMDAGFRSAERRFVERHYQLFSGADAAAGDGENRLEWMEVFQQYGRLVEEHLSTQLRRRLPDFDMDTFLAQMTERRDRLEGDIFELLLSFSDFSHFKEMMLDYRRFKDGEVPDLSGVITQVRLPG